MRPDLCTTVGTMYFYHILLFVAVSSAISLNAYRDFKCPTYSQWDMRAKTICNTTERYYCLFDVNEEKFTEFCRNGPSYDTDGIKAVLLGDIDGQPCENHRYQPFKFWTNGSDHCVFLKSYCKGEGQVVVDNGSPKSDVRCTCDYSKGYDFVKRPSNPCFCIPSEEDCSCYLKPCPEDAILTPDFECVHIDNWKATFNCEVIHVESSTTTPLKSTEPYIDNNIDVLDLRRSVAVVVLVFMILGPLLVLGGFFLYSKCKYILKSKMRQMEDSNVPENIKVLQQKEKYEWKVKLTHFVETKMSTHVFNSIKTEQCILITGPPGCGKSSLAFFVAFKMEEIEGYEVLVITHPDDVIKYAESGKLRIFIFENIFGIYSAGEYEATWWSRHGKLVNDIFSKNRDIKLIMTCKTHIYSIVDLNKDLCFRHMNLIGDSLKLLKEERRNIAKAYLTDSVITKLSDDDVISLYSCFPSLCAQYNHDSDKDPIKYFKYPSSFFNEEFQHLKKDSPLNFLALALLVVKNNSIDEEFFKENTDRHDQLLKDIASDVGYTNIPLKDRILSSLNSMENTFTRKSESGFSFLREEMFEIAAYYIGTSIIRATLKHGKHEYIKNRFLFESLYGQSSEFTIMLPKHLEQPYFDRQLREIKEGHIWSVFSDKQNKFPEFRTSFTNYLQKHVGESAIKTDAKDATVLHVVSSLGYSEYIPVFTKLVESMVNKKDAVGKTPLHIACYEGHLYAVKELINNMACMDELDENEYTPLDLACNMGFSEIVKLLLFEKANIRKRNKDGRTALHIACNNGNTGITKLLLEYKAAVNNHDKDGNTPLHLASKKGHQKVIQLLLENGADVNSIDNKDRTPLLIVCQKKNITLAKLLLEKMADIKKADSEGKVPLHYSCEARCRDLVNLLLSYDDDVKKSDLKGNTPLHFACLKGSLAIVETLFKHGVDVNAENKNHMTPLHFACQNGHKDIVISLISNGAVVNKASKHLKTPLHETCRQGDLEIAKRLLEKGANINVKDKYGITPLFCCCEQKHSEMAKYLLNSKADVNIKDEEGITPLYVACRENDLETVKVLLVFCSSVNDTNKDGCTPLYVACENNNLDIVEELMKANADVNQSDKKGTTPLHVSSQNGFLEIITVLLESEARVNVQDTFCNTPLLIAVTEGHTNAVKLLIRYEADINLCDKFKMSPLQVALQKKHEEIAEVLKCRQK